jgi:hypothetical protein
MVGAPHAARLDGHRPDPKPAAPPSGAIEPPPGDIDGRARRALTDKDAGGDDRGAGSLALDPLDSMTRALFSDGSQRLVFERPATSLSAPNPAPAVDTASLAARVSLEHVMSRFVRRVAWSGDANTGTARLELGAGALSGATLTIHSDQGAVRVALELPPGVDGAEWRERIAKRLGARGLHVAALEVE